MEAKVKARPRTVGSGSRPDGGATVVQRDVGAVVRNNRCCLNQCLCVLLVVVQQPVLVDVMVGRSLFDMVAGNGE